MTDSKQRNDKSRTDWAALETMTEEDIAAAIASDPDAAPIATEKQMKNAKLRMPKMPRK